MQETHPIVSSNEKRRQHCVSPGVNVRICTYIQISLPYTLGYIGHKLILYQDWVDRLNPRTGHFAQPSDVAVDVIMKEQLQRVTLLLVPGGQAHARSK